MVIVIRELTLKLKIEMINSTTNNAHTRYLYLDSPFLLALTNLYPDNKIPTANSPIYGRDNVCCSYGRLCLHRYIVGYGKKPPPLQASGL